MAPGGGPGHSRGRSARSGRGVRLALGGRGGAMPGRSAGVVWPGVAGWHAARSRRSGHPPSSGSRARRRAGTGAGGVAGVAFTPGWPRRVAPGVIRCEDQPGQHGRAILRGAAQRSAYKGRDYSPRCAHTTGRTALEKLRRTSPGYSIDTWPGLLRGPPTSVIILGLDPLLAGVVEVSGGYPHVSQDSLRDGAHGAGMLMTGRQRGPFEGWVA